MKKYSKGFTLIELLVVIAIIGILSSVVLASLNTARNKGTDAAIKANMANVRAQGEMWYDSQSKYDLVCASTTLGIANGLSSAAKAFSSVLTVTNTDATVSSQTIAVCHDADGGWAAAIPIKNPATAGYIWCVDSSGSAKEIAAAALIAFDVTCD